MDPVALNTQLRVVFCNRFLVGCVEDTPKLVVFRIVEQVAVGDSELILGGLLGLAKLLSGKGRHRMLIDELRHFASPSSPEGCWVFVIHPTTRLLLERLAHRRGLPSTLLAPPESYVDASVPRSATTEKNPARNPR